ncbi:ABC transporter B family member 4 like protein [Argiope bruennichi]|uniref:ABC transporter B family member 4 like protein n=1 Tax=Argiope bruennichi TaxID=94029 RepID=A0A8T0ECC9_ARGBR|nr:ABC transporter B family member 4 like protein [Argiope bruennichi]
MKTSEVDDTCDDETDEKPVLMPQISVTQALYPLYPPGLNRVPPNVSRLEDTVESATILSHPKRKSIVLDGKSNCHPAQNPLFWTAFVWHFSNGQIHCFAHLPPLVFSEPKEKILEENAYYCLIFLIMAVTSFTTSFLQTLLFSVASERVTSKFRKLVFSKMITQDLAWFDHPKNSVGSLCAKLTSDATDMQGEKAFSR